MNKTETSFLEVHENIVLTFDLMERNKLRFRSMMPAGIKLTEPLKPLIASEAELDVALHCNGENRQTYHGFRLAGSSPGIRLEYIGKRTEIHPFGKLLIISHYDPEMNLKVESFYLFVKGSPVIRRYVSVTNHGASAVGIEYLSSAMLHNLSRLGTGDYNNRLRIHLAHSTWGAECQWQNGTPSQFGIEECGVLSVMKLNSLGNWSTGSHLPMGMIEDTSVGVIWFWQIEHNGSWHWELSQIYGSISLYAGGPDEENGNAWKNLEPGQTYTSVPVSIGCVKGGFDDAIAALTRYRRVSCLKEHIDSKVCPIIFNDYMHCLRADPTIEKELPLIEAASRIGCNYYVVDAGWYSEIGEFWQPVVGAWQPSKTRFGAEGIEGLMRLIKKFGLVPGLWIEIEAVGKDSSIRERSDEWFFCRHGKRVINHHRLHLDFRSKEVRDHADDIFDRLILEYKVGYIKIDYNMTFQSGTDQNIESPGQGLLEHCRSYLAWMDRLRVRYPHVVLENCGSGGMRMDYATLSRYHLQSASDQEDYRKNPAIIVGALAAVLPEQLAGWSFPLKHANAQQASFNMVNAMLCRINLSGPLDCLSKEALEMVYNGINVYKKYIQSKINHGIPFFPLGMPKISDTDTPVVVGMHCSDETFFAVWRLNGGDKVNIPSRLQGEAMLLYPCELGIHIENTLGFIRVNFPSPYMGAIIRIKK